MPAKRGLRQPQPTPLLKDSSSKTALIVTLNAYTVGDSFGVNPIGSNSPLNTLD